MSGAHKALPRLMFIMKAELPEKDFMRDFEYWESMVAQFEKETNERLADSVKIAAILGSVTGNLAEHLRLTASTNSSYADVRRIVTNYYQSKQVYQVPPLMASTSSTSASTYANNHGPMPMDIGALKGSRHKGWHNKGKGKGQHHYGQGKGRFNNWTSRTPWTWTSGTPYKGQKGSHKGKGKGST